MTRTALLLALTIPLVYLAMVAFGRWLKRRLGVQLGLMYQLFAVALAVYLSTEWRKVDFPFSEHLAPALIVLGTFFLIALMRRFLWEYYFQNRRQIQIPKFFSQVAALLIFLVVLISVFHVRYGIKIPGLLAGSGIAAVIIGLAMQDLLGNILSGFALHVGKPFQVGDWLILDNRHAEVVEINWRSTRLRTNDNIHLDVPNNQIAKQTLINLTGPTRLHAMRLQVGADLNTPPNRVKDALLRATANATGVLSRPGPSVFLFDFVDSSITYEVKFWLEDHSRYNEIVDSIRTNIWYEFQRDRIRIPFRVRTIQIERPSGSSQLDSRNSARVTLRQQPLFQCLSEAQLDILLAGAKLERFGRGERLIEQGRDGDSMFVLLRGQASVGVERNGESSHVAVLRVGDCFGEMSLLTGEKRAATVVAVTDCDVIEIDKLILGGILQNKPELLHELSQLLARRRLETEGILAETAQRHSSTARQREYETSFLTKIRAFFEL